MRTVGLVVKTSKKGSKGNKGTSVKAGGKNAEN